MARLYSNENFPLPVVEALRALGHDVVTIQESGKANQEYPDDAVLEEATADRRAVLTINRKHFLKLHRQNPAHHGIVLCTADLDFSGQAARIHDVIQTQKPLAGKILRVNRPPTG
ncbi:MAG: DUF5615 family PIN-like protein [Anaerolineae bacterium]